MTPTNRTIEEKLAIVQQLRNNSNETLIKPTDKFVKTTQNIQLTQSIQNHPQHEESGHFLTFLIIRLVLCVLIFGVVAFIGSKNSTIAQYVNAMITSEENGNLIDFMSPFTYTLQENVESSSEEAVETQENSNTDTDVPSTE